NSLKLWARLPTILLIPSILKSCLLWAANGVRVGCSSPHPPPLGNRQLGMGNRGGSPPSAAPPRFHQQQPGIGLPIPHSHDSPFPIADSQGRGGGVWPADSQGGRRRVALPLLLGDRDQLLRILFRSRGSGRLGGAGGPDDTVAVAIATLEIRRTRIAFGEPVVPHAAAAHGAAHLFTVRSRRDGRGTALGVRCRTALRLCAARLPVLALVGLRGILDGFGTASVAVEFHPVLLVRIKLVGDAKADGGALERVRRCLLVVASRPDILAHDAEYLQTRLEGADGVVVVASIDGRQHLECETPLARHYRVEPLTNRVGFDVADEAREMPPVARDGLPVLAPGNGARWHWCGERAPHLALAAECILSCDHVLLLSRRPVDSRAAVRAVMCRTTRCTSATAGQSLPCRQYHPYRSRKTR